MAALSTVRTGRATKVGVQLGIVVVVALAAWWWFAIACFDRGKEAPRPDELLFAELAGITNAITKDFHNEDTSIKNIFEFSPGSLNNRVFRSAYPKLSPAGQEYFKKRFREVFGIEYVPDEPGRRAYLWGTKDTLWDGKGLEWRF